MSYKCRAFKILSGGIDNVKLGTELLVHVQIVLNWITEVEDGEFVASWYKRESGSSMRTATCRRSERDGCNVWRGA